MTDEPYEISEYETAEQALEALREFSKKYPATSKAIREITPDEMGSLLFVGAGPDVVIQGMHYKDSALDMTVCPNLFPGTEKGQIIAAFPDSLVTAIMEKLENNYEKDYRDYIWQKILGRMLETVVEMLEGNPLPKINWEKWL